jgi:hypothetical protein
MIVYHAEYAKELERKLDELTSEDRRLRQVCRALSEDNREYARKFLVLSDFIGTVKAEHRMHRPPPHVEARQALIDELRERLARNGEPWTDCCAGTGIADYAAVPCTDPECTARPAQTAAEGPAGSTPTTGTPGERAALEGVLSAALSALTVAEERGNSGACMTWRAFRNSLLQSLGRW